MASTNHTKINEICKILPNDPSSELSLPLTFLDLLWLRLDPPSRLFFYEFPVTNTDFLNVFLPKLKKSLSVTLNHYLPAAGSLTWQQDSKVPVIRYETGDGVSLTVAESSHEDFRFLSGNEFRDSEELGSLLPDFPSSETQSPVITLQITLFPNQGFSVGYLAHHAVMDGKTVSLFMHSWAYLCKNGEKTVLPPELTPSYDRSFVEQLSELDRIYPRKYGKPLDLENKTLILENEPFPPDTFLGTFKLTRTDIDGLKKLASGGGARISSFIVSSAYAFVCLVKAKKLVSEKAVIGINVNARGRIEPPVSSTYFGNCVVACAGGGDAENYRSEDGFANAVGTVNEALNSLNDGLLGLAKKLNEFSEDLSKDAIKGIKVFVIAGSPRFELYKADFGWGKPKKVEMVSIAKTGAFYLSDDRDGNGGIEIGVGLNKNEAEVFKSVFDSGLKA